MSQLLQEEYINRLSHRLERFQKVGAVYKCRCPICGDSESNSRKTRGYFYQVNDGSGGRKYNFKCHNCNASMSFLKFLVSVFPDLSQEYRLSTIKTDHSFSFAMNTKGPVVDWNSEECEFPNIKNSSTFSTALAWLRNRKIPEESIGCFGFTGKFADYCVGTFLIGSEKEKDYVHNRLPNDPRILIPYRTRNGALFALQGRAIDSSSGIRYMTVKRTDNHMKIFGLDRMNKTKRIYVTEGPFDSMFLPNAVAIGGAGFSSEFLDSMETVRKNIVVVYDNEPRNKQIVESIQQAINFGVEVVIWKNGFTDQKDINDMVVAENKSSTDILDFIQSHTFSGVRASFELGRWAQL